MKTNSALRSTNRFLEHHLSLWLGLLLFLSLQLVQVTSPAIWFLCSALYCGLVASAIRSSLAQRALRIPFVLLAWGPLALAMSHARHNAYFHLPKSGHHLAQFTLCELGPSPSRRADHWNALGSLYLPSRVNALESRPSKIRCRLLIPKARVSVYDGRWQLLGKLSQKPFSQLWEFHPIKAHSWRPRPNLWSRLSARWALLRFRAKTHFSEHITASLPATRARAFIIGLCTGKQPDLRLSFDLSRVGLSHLLAVSGFHFACVIGACEWTLRRCAPNRFSFLLVLPAWIYFGYMGPSASVFRAAIMSVWRIFAQLRMVPYRPLEGLGWSLALWCALFPECTQELGFMLSYLCTAALLLFAGPMCTLVETLWPMAPPSAPKLWRGVRTTVQAMIGVNLSAHLITFTPQLYLWHFFPVASIWYNALLPPCVGCLMQLLLVACTFTLIFPPLAHLLFRCAHALLAPLVAATGVSRPWECVLWGECSATWAAWSTAILLGGGLVWNARNYRPTPFDRWIV